MVGVRTGSWMGCIPQDGQADRWPPRSLHDGDFNEADADNDGIKSVKVPATIMGVSEKEFGHVDIPVTIGCWPT